MNTRTIKRNELGTVAAVLEENISDAAMDQLLIDRHDEIEGLLDEARNAKERGEFAPLEPLHVFLRRARERFESKR
jgi:hypothetical protein